MEFELRYYLRNPPQWRRPWDELYRDVLEQAEVADRHGFDRVTLSEHHFTEDGYLPSPFVLGAAIAARTTRVKIALGLVLLVLKHPVQTAEDAAVLDIISGGRLELTVGGGYLPEEFAGYGVPINQRPSRMEEALEIVRRCWEEDEFSFHGRHWNLENVAVAPKPVQQPRPRILLGGSSVAAAHRAARFADGFSGAAPLHEEYRAEMVRLGKDPGPPMPTPVSGYPRLFFHVSADPVAAWKVIGPHVLYESNAYAEWASQGRALAYYTTATDPDDLVAAGTHLVVTPAEAIEFGRQMQQAQGPNARMVIQPLVAGLPRSVPPTDPGRRGPDRRPRVYSRAHACGSGQPAGRGRGR